MARPLHLLALVLLLASSAPGRADSPGGPHFVVIKAGDTLSGLAARHKVSVSDLRQWNRGLISRDLQIRAGDRIRVRPPTETPDKESASSASGGPTWRDHIAVKKGDTLGVIARREGVPLTDLLRWNKLTERSTIRVGDRLIIERPGVQPPSVSVGRVTDGRLEHGRWLDKGPGYRLRFPKNAYGTEHTVKVLRRCAKTVHEAFPGTADILYGDLSRPGGGRFPPHESHQSGRDADVGYYLAGNVQNATMHYVKANEIDYAKTWALLRCYLRTGQVVRVFIDTSIQKAMAAHLAATEGMRPGQLRRLFEVIGGEDALIRHAPHHDTHLHVRFACQSSDKGCALETGEKRFRL